MKTRHRRAYAETMCDSGIVPDLQKPVAQYIHRGVCRWPGYGVALKMAQSKTGESLETAQAYVAGGEPGTAACCIFRAGHISRELKNIARISCRCLRRKREESTRFYSRG